MFDKEDYQALLDRARKKRNQHPYTMYVVFAAAVILVVLLIIGVGALAKRRLSEGAAATEPQQQMQETNFPLRSSAPRRFSSRSRQRPASSSPSPPYRAE